MTASWWRSVAGPGEVRVDIRAIAHGWRRSACRADSRPLTHRRLPVGSARGQVDLAEDQVDHAVEELVLVGHMVVQRHGLDPEGVAELAHTERRDPALVGEGDGSTQHPSPCSEGFGALWPAWSSEPSASLHVRCP